MRLTPLLKAGECPTWNEQSVDSREAVDGVPVPLCSDWEQERFVDGYSWIPPTPRHYMFRILKLHLFLDE